MKLYLAGSLFNEAEIKQRLYEGKLLKQRFPELDVFNPIEQPFNDKKDKVVTPEEIFTNDTNAIIDSEIFLADLTNEDAGVMVELGIAIALKKPIIIGVLSDIRREASNQYEIPPYGMNHYVLGGLQKYGHLVYSFEDALNLLEAQLNLMK